MKWFRGSIHLETPIAGAPTQRVCFHAVNFHKEECQVGISIVKLMAMTNTSNQTLIGHHVNYSIYQCALDATLLKYGSHMIASGPNNYIYM